MHSDTGAVDDTSDVESQDEEEADNENEDEGCEKDVFFDEESSDEDTIAEPVQFKDSRIAVPLNYVSGEHGQGRIIRPHDTDVLYSIPYPVFYRYRGEGLKRLNRLEYYSLVQINRRGKESGADGDRKSTRLNSSHRRLSRMPSSA